jgi:hypothetical protein
VRRPAAAPASDLASDGHVTVARWHSLAPSALQGPPASDHRASSAMEIGVGPLSGCYDTVVCLSDFETDDLLCLRMLASRCADVPFRMVVGEGDQDKSPLAAHVLGKYGYKGKRPDM